MIRKALPGHITLVVTPHKSNLLENKEPKFDRVELKRIQSTLASSTPAGAELHVINATFDRLYVRAHLDVEHKSHIEPVNTALCSSLSVWTASSHLQRFGWSINLSELQAELESHALVREVHGLSVLSLGRHGYQNFSLLDTAREGAQDVFASAPWALPVSANIHQLRPTQLGKNHLPQPIGVGQLIIGETLAVG